MFVNYEQDNTIEGTYLLIEKINFHDSTLIIQLPEGFYVNSSNFNNWVIGWGEKKPYYDAGVENIREISKIDIQNNKISLGCLLRGNGFPTRNQSIVFWNKTPSGFTNNIEKAIINPEIWPEFAGYSISLSAVKYDSILKKWIMIVNECDTSKIQIYAAMSDDLINWEAANNGNPILRAADFKNCNWAGMEKFDSICQTPFVSDIVSFNNKWFLFLDGYSSDGKRHIGIAVSDKTLLGPYKIIDEPILSPGIKGNWNDESCFYAKVEKYKNGFIMFYDGRNKNGLERIGMATSNDLLSWNNSINNPVIDQHSGWRSFPNTTEPNYLEIRNDTIMLMCAGVKKFNMGLWHQYITKKMFIDKSGNVDDTQLGVYISTDMGKSFVAHANNPIFTNDYSNIYENEHMGGSFCRIKTDSIEYIIYTAKSSYLGLKYNILLRQRTYK